MCCHLYRQTANIIGPHIANRRRPFSCFGYTIMRTAQIFRKFIKANRVAIQKILIIKLLVHQLVTKRQDECRVGVWPNGQPIGLHIIIHVTF